MSPNTPSTTSSSASQHPPEGQYRVIRKRNRVPLSCAPCRHRKLKCNRSQPCENCVKRGDAHSCTYAQRKKSNTPQNSSTPDDMQNRIDRLEGLVLSLMTNGTQSTGPSSAMAAVSNNSGTGSCQDSDDYGMVQDGPNGTEDSDTEQVTKSFGILKVDNNNKSYYISEAHWASVLSDIAEVRNYFACHHKQYEEQAEKLDATKDRSPNSTLLFGALKPSSRAEIMSSFPSRYITDVLITRFFNYYDSTVHIFHTPTFKMQYNKHWEDPSQTSLVWIGMLFVMMRLAMLSFHREGDEPQEFHGKSLDMAASFRDFLAQCLILADYTKPHAYLIECLVLHLHAESIETKEAEISVWILVGVITRLAMRMGYHRDPKMFPNIAPFQAEMRRRVWSFVRQADVLFSFQMGLPNMIRLTDSDAEIPRNLYDGDFGEDSKKLPPSRPLSEPTPVSYLITKAHLTSAFTRVTEYTSSIRNVSYDTVLDIDAELRRARDLIPEHLSVRPIEERRLDPSMQTISRFNIISIYHKAQCVLHRPYLVRARENPRFTYSRRTCIDSAMELLRFQSMIHSATRLVNLRSNPLQVSSLTSADFLLAATIVCLDLYHGLQVQAAGRPSGDTYTWGGERQKEMLAAIRRSKEIWNHLRDESLDAWKAAQVLGMMEEKMNLALAGTDATGVCAFEPQDEKQSAAMTLGLLSSGMAPSGPTTSNDPSVTKMAETPLVPTGSLGTAVQTSSSLSPFNNVFYQMPDMNSFLDLDWSAWDAYIQNSTVDSSNQWWPTPDFQPLTPQQQAVAHAPLAPSIPTAAVENTTVMEGTSTSQAPPHIPEIVPPQLPQQQSINYENNRTNLPGTDNTNSSKQLK